MKNLKSFNEMFDSPSTETKENVELETYKDWESWEEACQNSPEFQSNLRFWSILPGRSESQKYFEMYLRGNKLFCVITDKSTTPFKYYGFFLTHDGKISNCVDNRDRQVRDHSIIDNYLEEMGVDKKELN
jgi:hypothetical protein